MDCAAQPVRAIPRPRHHPSDPRHPPPARPDRNETHATVTAANRLERSRSGAWRLIASPPLPISRARESGQSLRHGRRHVYMDGVHTRTSPLRGCVVGLHVGVSHNGTRLWRCKVRPIYSPSGTKKQADRDDWRRSRDKVERECLRGPLGDAGSGARQRNVWSCSSALG